MSDDDETTPATTDQGESMPTRTTDPAHRPFDEIPTPSPTFADRPLDDPLPYGAGFTPTQQFGYGVGPETFAPAPAPADTGSTAVARRGRSGSPVLAIAGLLSMGVAVWTIVGAPAISTTFMWAAGLVVVILVGLLMVVRR